jgi:uncharacterized membrane protein YphA (DoxX/SURF4 family)
VQNPVQGIAAVVGRVMIATVFLMSAIGNKIPKFSDVAGYMAAEGVPLPQLMLVGAIVFLIVGSLSIIAGYKARICTFGKTEYELILVEFATARKNGSPVRVFLVAAVGQAAHPDVVRARLVELDVIVHPRAGAISPQDLLQGRQGLHHRPGCTGMVGFRPLVPRARGHTGVVRRA